VVIHLLFLPSSPIFFFFGVRSLLTVDEVDIATELSNLFEWAHINSLRLQHRYNAMHVNKLKTKEIVFHQLAHLYCIATASMPR